jgi:serine phosphatase RsbU (regulator of sigma subunit)
LTLFLSGMIGSESRVWALDEERQVVGRSSRNSIQIPDATVSKEHAEILRQAGQWLIRDLGSRNGTRVNGADASDLLKLKSGDRIEVGHVLLTVTDHDPSHRPTFNDATVMGSSLRLRADEILDRKAPSGLAGSPVVHLLAEAGRLLVLPRPLQETCDQLLAFVEKAVKASRYVLLLQKDSGAEPEQIAARIRGGRANEPLAMSRSIMKTVVDECTSVFTADAALDPRFQGQHSIVAQGVHSAMAVPLFDNQRVLGVLYADSQDFTVTFNSEQLELLTLLANMAAVKITNARLLEAEQDRARLAQELATATRIQRGLLPSEPPHVPGYTIDAFLETCYEVGGDLYDFHVVPDGRLFFMLCDVSGKGMGAALLMSSFLASGRVLFDTCRDPAELAVRLSGILHRSTDAKHFITGFVGFLDPANGTVHYVNAGHPAACLVLGSEMRHLPSTGIPFGVLPEARYASESVVLRPGEILALFSDGIPEAQRGDAFFEEERLYEALLAGAGCRDLEQVRATVLQRVEAFLAGAPRSDDLTLMLIRREASAGA